MACARLLLLFATLLLLFDLSFVLGGDEFSLGVGIFLFDRTHITLLCGIQFRSREVSSLKKWGGSICDSWVFFQPSRLSFQMSAYRKPVPELMLETNINHSSNASSKVLEGDGKDRRKILPTLLPNHRRHN